MQDSDPRVLLLGCGYTLSRVMRRLRAGEAHAVVRSEKSLQALRAEGIEATILDLSREDQLKALADRLRSIEVIVDSVPPLAPPDPACGVRNVVKVFNASVRRIVYLSTTGVFGGDDGGLVDERTPPSPRHERALARLQCEETYRQGAAPVVALRIPAIYGPGRGIGQALKRGSYRLIEKGERWSNRIHVEDLAEVVCRCIDAPGVLPPVIAISDDAPTHSREVAEFYCQKFSLSAPASISLAQAQAQGLYTMIGNQRVNNSLMKSVLGVTLRYPSFRDGAASEFEEA